VNIAGLFLLRSRGQDGEVSTLPEGILRSFAAVEQRSACPVDPSLHRELEGERDHRGCEQDAQGLKQNSPMADNVRIGERDRIKQLQIDRDLMKRKCER
jgi:hypothetical protein